MITIALLLIGSICLVGLAYFAGRYAERVSSLERRISQLEEAQPKRQTHNTTAGIEDASANVVHLMFDVEEMAARLDTVRRILGVVREGPHVYPKE